MKIAHAAVATPHRCGLYETTRELVAAERALGLDARIVDPVPNEDYYPGDEDRGVPVSRDFDWALEADLLVSHSGFDRTPLADSDQPVVHVAHGRPLSTFMGERNGGAPGMTYAVQRRKHDRFKAVATFWPEYAPYFRNLWHPKPVHVLPAPVDLGYWRPGSSDYDFGGRRGAYNVIMTDPWSREDATPYHCIHAFRLFRDMYPDARLHMLAWDGNKKGLGGITELLGEGGGCIMRWCNDVRRVMWSADMLITSHRIYTRSIREAMACGLQVVSGRDCHPEDIEQFARTMRGRREAPEDTRRDAERLFDPLNTAKAFKRVLPQPLALVA